MHEMYISKPSARRRFDQLCEEKNEAMPLIEVTRELQIDGRTVTQTYQRRKKAISDGAQNTGKALIQSFAYQFKRLVNTMPVDMINEAGTPSLKTNNVKMAKFRGGLSDRTIRNHIRELKNIGAITDYKFHGSKKDFELWIDTRILFGTDEMPEIFKTDQPDSLEKTFTPTPSFSDASSSDSDPKNDTNFPHRQLVTIENSKVTKNTTTRNVEEISTIRRQEYGNKPSTDQNLPLSQPVRGGMETKKGGGGPRIIVDNSPKSWINTLPSWKSPGLDQDYHRLPRAYQHYVAQFWRYAHKSLWPGKVFLPQEQFAAMNAITAGVYQKVFHQNPGENNLDKFQKLLFKAIDKASMYYARSENRYPGDPVSKFRSGKGYFDAENSRGFNVAYRWAFQDAAAANEKYGEKVLTDAIRHLKNHRSGKIPKRLQHYTLIELYSHYETKIKQKFSTEVLQDFYKQALTLPAFR